MTVDGGHEHPSVQEALARLNGYAEQVGVDLGRHAATLAAHTAALDTVQRNTVSLTAALDVAVARLGTLGDQVDRAVPRTLVGMGTHWKPSTAATVEAAQTLTGRRVQVRRVYGAGIPSSLTAAGLGMDRVAGRNVLLSYKPPSPNSTDVAKTAGLAASCKAGGMGPDRLDVIIYHEPYDNFPDAAVFRALFDAHAAPWQKLGYRTWICLTAWSVNHNNALLSHWSDRADGLAIDIYGDSSASAHVDLARAVTHAAERGKPLSIPETAGGPKGFDVAKGSAFLRSLVEWCAEHQPAHVCYWSDTKLDSAGVATYDCRLESTPAYLPWYDQLWASVARRT